MKITAIIVAAGTGSRFMQEKNKVFALMQNANTILKNALIPFENESRIEEIIISYNPKDAEDMAKEVAFLKTPYKLVQGGSTRAQSVKNALDSTDAEVVLIHDAARPFIDEKLVNRCINCVLEHRSAVAAIACTDTVGFVENTNTITKTDRSSLCNIQTPQGFFRQDLQKAFEKAESDGLTFTDEGGLYCKYIRKAFIYEGSIENIKITHPADLYPKEPFRVGTGYDVHTLCEGRKLILCGIEIPHTKGLLGHSDADVAVHALMDSLLSAVALRDIGYYFSDKDPKYKDADSMLLLKQVVEMVDKCGYRSNNASLVIMAEKPKLSSYVPSMRRKIADALGIDIANVGITCTTTESVGMVGREEAIACHAVCTVIKA